MGIPFGIKNARLRAIIQQGPDRHGRSQSPRGQPRSHHPALGSIGEASDPMCLKGGRSLGLSPLLVGNPPATVEFKGDHLGGEGCSSVGNPSNTNRKRKWMPLNNVLRVVENFDSLERFRFPDDSTFGAFFLLFVG